MEITLAHRATSPSAPLIVLVDSTEHPLDLATSTRNLASAVAVAYVDDWNASLTPWKAPGLYREEQAFGGAAATTLAGITHELVPALMRKHSLAPTSFALAGYSLAGLFALYALLNEGLFCAAASMSGSLWYDGWLSYLQQASLPAADGAGAGGTRFAYLSVGTKEKRASQARLKTVEERTLLTEELLREKGIVTELYLGPGGHLQHVQDRIARAFTALDTHLVS